MTRENGIISHKRKCKRRYCMNKNSVVERTKAQAVLQRDWKINQNSAIAVLQSNKLGTPFTSTTNSRATTRSMLRLHVVYSDMQWANSESLAANHRIPQRMQ